MDEQFNPSEFFKAIRQSASVRAGAVIFGQAQIAYYDTLKEQGFTDDQAYNMLAHTTSEIIRGIFHAAPAICEVVLKAATLWEALGMKPTGSEKEVPGSGS